jgi:D-alanyl-lipoteichoic acid acyltransferase DltB (MBOAT superfamily)
MLFHSWQFVFVFLPVVLAGFFLIGRTRRDLAIAWLVVGSLVFYAFGMAAHLVLIAGSVAFNFAAGAAIRARRRDGAWDAARHITIAAVAANLLLLGFFKYANFFVDNVNEIGGAGFGAIDLILPLAISFFTLQQIAYLVDVYKGLAEETSFLHYCLFVTFFPQLIAGPIVHHSEMLPQFRRATPFRFHAGDFSEGLTIFLLGLFKKAIIADSLAVYADPVFAATAEGAEPGFYAAWTGTLAFGFQIYFDFSGYSDMAIGLARMMSIRLPVNFAAPYLASNIIEFWRRWHITLSRFLRDYLYVPLGGNRHGAARRYVNLMATMLIGGLWHGAAWTFVLWGGLHGLYLVVNHGWRRVIGDKSLGPAAGVARAVSVAFTFLAVTVAWVPFRAENLATARRMYEGMVGFHGAALPAQLVDLVPALGLIATVEGYVPLLGGGTILGLTEMTLLLLLCFVVVFSGSTLHELSQRQRVGLLVLTGAFTIQKVVFGSAASEFIYFRF